jgi:hypothetical protein
MYVMGRFFWDLIYSSVTGLYKLLVPPGFQKVGTAGNRQTIFGWKKGDLDTKKIGHIIAREKKSCPSLTNWTFGSITSDIITLYNKY